MADSLLQHVQNLTGWSDAHIGALLGLSAHTVQSYRTGRRTEYVNRTQRAALIDALRSSAAGYDNLAAELELLA